VKISSRLHRLPGALRSFFVLRFTLLCAPILAALALGTAPASALVVEVGGTKFGVQRHSAPASLFAGEGLQPATFANAGGDPVVHQNSTYAIFWDPDYRYLDPWTEVIDQFFQNMSTASGALESVFAVDTQYTDKTDKPAYYRSMFRGSYPDKASYPATAGCKDPNPLEAPDAIACLSAKQVREQLESFISREKLPKGMETIYYVLTPPGVTVCTDEGETASACSSNSSANSFCSYHAAITPTNPTTGDKNTILYGVIPWVAGSAGDPLLGRNDQAPAYECQDGGFDPSSKPAEQKEHPKVSSKEEEEKRLSAEKKENEELTTYEEQQTKGIITEEELAAKKTELGKRGVEREGVENEEREKREKLEGPRIQEPNQTSCPNVYDGGCDIGLADVIITQIASEQQDIVTDPLLNAWQDKNHNEAVDECRNVFALVLGGASAANEESAAGSLYDQSLGAGDYYLNDAFNAAAYRIYQPGAPCLQHVNLAPAFTAPTPVKNEEIVGFNGLESNISLNAAASFPGGVEKPTYATYTWNFGDGGPTVSGYAPGAPPCSETPWLIPCAAGVFHSYKYGGTYEVTLTVRDVGGNEASVSHPITVDGPPPPSPEPTPSSTPAGSGSGAATPSGTGASSKTGASAKTPGPAPVASAAAVPSSLAKTTRKGLTVRYSVNQQVAGQFQVLLAASIAHRIGLHPPLATGLPAGTPAQVVIGNAILVTTRSGRGTIKIQFGKVTAARLRRLGKVSLMLRLNLRNSSGGTTSVLSKFTLR
jgi:PKD domain